MNKVLELKSKVLSFVQSRGPVIPIKVAKHFGSNTIFISAILSELISGNQVKLTKAKIGSSPLYYTPGQEAKLGDALKDYLKQYPKKAFDLLKDNKVLRDVDCEPAMRAALRDIPDFAVPLKVTIEGNEELFWKWHVLENEDTKILINNILERIYNKEKPKEEVKEEPKEEIKEEPKKDLSEQEQINEEIKQEFEEPEPVEEQEDFKEPEEPKEEPKEEFEEEVEDKEEEQVEEEPEDESESTLLQEQQEQETLLTPDKEKPKEKDFEKTIISFLNRKNINILEKQTIKKNREFNFVVKVPSNVGDLMYFVKAKNKKKVNEGELLLAFTEGQNLKLPTIYVTNAETTKKAINYMEKNMKGLLYKKINF